MGVGVSRGHGVEDTGGHGENFFKFQYIFESQFMGSMMKFLGKKVVVK